MVEVSAVARGILLEALGSQGQPGDAVRLYFAGHG